MVYDSVASAGLGMSPLSVEGLSLRFCVGSPAEARSSSAAGSCIIWGRVGPFLFRCTLPYEESEVGPPFAQRNLQGKLRTVLSFLGRVKKDRHYIMGHKSICVHVEVGRSWCVQLIC